MNSLWFKGCKTKAEKEDRKRQLGSYRPAFDELTVILQSLRKKPAIRDYSDPGWSNKQVAVNEYNAAIDELINLMTE